RASCYGLRVLPLEHSQRRMWGKRQSRPAGMSVAAGEHRARLQKSIRWLTWCLAWARAAASVGRSQMSGWGQPVTMVAGRGAVGRCHDP
ncbi:MAG: hypothetical protein ACPIOQ_35495, partial [Promethearchaeia archaeon]